MKEWVKALLWLGLGGGLGFFIGQQVGFKQGYERCEDQVSINEKPEPINDGSNYNKVAQAMKEYRGDYDGDEVMFVPAVQVEDEIPDMPTEKDIEIDPDIPQLHPTQLEPEVIGEEEYNANIWNYELENLIFYELDEVLYNETTQSIIENPNNVVGIGTLFGFGGDPNNPVDTLYVKNETFGTLFRIDRVDGAFCDLVDGQIHPDI